MKGRWKGLWLFTIEFDWLDMDGRGKTQFVSISEKGALNKFTRHMGKGRRPTIICKTKYD
jgi:hypothetical protein